MLNRILPIALLCASVPLAAQAPALPQLSLAQQTMLRCSAAFALVAGEQARGLPAALTWTPLAQRGREFFVRASAQLMDQTGATRAQIQGLVAREVTAIRAGAPAGGPVAPSLAPLKGPCTTLLDGSIPPAVGR